jgi:hypothetical protein
MATIKRGDYTQGTTLSSALTTELNSLATGSGSAASAAIDNSTNLDLFGDFVLDVTYGTNPTAGSTVDLYIIPSIDATNYSDYTSGATPFAPKEMLVKSWELKVAITAQKLIVRDVPLPKKFKVAVINNAGQAMAASGNTVKFETYSMTVA